jgi:FAD/FMN-containing dehydrogenase
LGLITRAVLRLRPRLASQNVALIGSDRFTDVVRLLRRLESELGGQLSAFEVMWSEFYDMVTTPPARGRAVLPAGHRFYTLVEGLGGDVDADRERFQAVLAALMEDGAVSDAAVAQSQAECDAIWALRDDAEQVQRRGPLISLDVSLKLSTVESFEASLRELLTARWPQMDLILFGHVGDGNLHIVICCNGERRSEVLESITSAVYGALGDMGGSVSAEHGIGLDKLDYLPLSRSAGELALMRTIKFALDPHNILNPGKVVAG